MRYIRKVIRKRRSHPQDDLVSALARVEEAGDTLSEDELLAMIILRYASEDVTIAGVTILRGEMVIPVIPSANRDERQFADADTLDITREPNKHLTFGLGAHFCVGASLARLEGQIALGMLLSLVVELNRVVGCDVAEPWRDACLWMTRSAGTRWATGAKSLCFAWQVRHTPM